MFICISVEVKEKLASSEKKFERLMEMCKTTSLDFRQAIYQLLGFRIDIPKSKTYKLMSMYSSSSDDYLLFQVRIHYLCLLLRKVIHWLV